MKLKSIFFAFLCFNFLAVPVWCGAQNQIDKQGRKQGHWIRTDKDGTKIYQGSFKNDLEIDTFLYFYPNGTLRIRNIYSTPGRYCSHEAFDEQGHLLAKGFYNQKNRDGQWQIFTEKGNLIKIASYRMGIKEGLQVIFTSTGDTAEVCYWKDNHRDGRWWKRIGDKGAITGTYVKGALEGRLVEYGEDGTIIRDGNYKNGEKNGSYKYYENKVLTIDENWNNGTILDRKILISTPQPTYISIFSIAYFYPKNKEQSILYKTDGTMLNCQESIETIFGRVGYEQFVTVDRKNNITSNVSCIQGLTRDEEGREILSLDPQPAFSVFPDEDCLKMVKSLKRLDELDK